MTRPHVADADDSEPHLPELAHLFTDNIQPPALARRFHGTMANGARAFLREWDSIADLNAMVPDAPLDARFWRRALLLFLAVVLLALPQAGLIPLLDRDEPRFAEASREMLQSRDIIVPTFNHAPRYAKPPLIYWCQAISFAVLGENALAARLPSILATAATAVVLLAWGRNLGSDSIGLAAGLSYAFCLQTVQQGRVATADGLLIFFMTLTAYAGWRLITSPPPSHSMRSYLWDTILALGFAGGFLAKGPEAFLPLFPLLYSARHSTNRRARGEIVINFLLGAMMVLFWAIPAYIESHGDYWRVGLSEGVGQRVITGLQGHGASTIGWYLVGVAFYYPALFWISALPWSPLLLIQRRKLFAVGNFDPLDTYLLLNIGLLVAVFSLMVTKLPHYTLPAFPLIALLLARRWESTGLASSMPIRLAAGFGIAVAILTAIFVPIALACHMTPSPVGELVRAARDSLQPETDFALVDFREPNALWEMRGVTQKFGGSIGETDVLPFLRQPGPRAVVVSTALWQKLGPGADPSWKIFEAQGWNTAKGWDSARGTPAYIDLTLVAKP